MEGEQQQKKEFFKREDIETMQKDIGQLREMEAARERERITSLKTAEEARAERDRAERTRKEAEDRARMQEELRGVQERAGAVKQKWSPPPSALPYQQPSRLMPTGPGPRPTPGPDSLAGQPEIETPPSQPLPSRSEKIILRVGIIIIIALSFTNIFLFWNWYLRGQEPAPINMPQAGEEKPPATTTSANVLPSPITPTPTTTLPAVAPASLITTEATSEIEVAGVQNLTDALSQALAASSTDGFTRLKVRLIDKNSIAGLKEFFEGMDIKPPSGLTDKIANDFTLFLYTEKQSKRLGFVAQTTDKAGVAGLLAGWEKAMENDLAGLYVLMGKQGPAITPFFRTVPYKGASLRYQTFTRQDLGICYTVFNNYLVFTSSWQSLLRAVDKLPK